MTVGVYGIETTSVSDSGRVTPSRLLDLTFFPLRFDLPLTTVLSGGVHNNAHLSATSSGRAHGGARCLPSTLVIHAWDFLLRATSIASMRLLVHLFQCNINGRLTFVEKRYCKKKVRLKNMLTHWRAWSITD